MVSAKSSLCEGRVVVGKINLAKRASRECAPLALMVERRVQNDVKASLLGVGRAPNYLGLPPPASWPPSFSSSTTEGSRGRRRKTREAKVQTCIQYTQLDAASSSLRIVLLRRLLLRQTAEHFDRTMRLLKRGAHERPLVLALQQAEDSESTRGGLRLPAPATLLGLGSASGANGWETALWRRALQFRCY